jgi:hypothetical protein
MTGLLPITEPVMIVVPSMIVGPIVIVVPVASLRNDDAACESRTQQE